MAQRLKVSKMLHEVLGSSNVYYQPPPTLKMKFPCIVYERIRINTEYADNIPYHLNNSYRVTYIDSSPTSEVPDKLAKLPGCAFETTYINDNQYYNVFRIS